MTSVAEVTQRAAAQLGETENPPNSNVIEFSKWAHIPGSPWCAAFVSWCSNLEGFGEGDYGDSPYDHVYTPIGAEIFRAAGRWRNGVAGMKRGDFVYFNFPDSLDRIQHVGICDKDYDGSGSVTCVEGNTSAGSTGSQDNGGGVFRRVRPTSHVVGYGRPAYGAEALKRPDYNFPSGKRAYLDKGDKGADVKLLNGDLDRYFKTKRKEKSDPKLVERHGNKFTTATLKALKQFQHEQGLDVDGRAGRHTLHKLNGILRRRKARR